MSDPASPFVIETLNAASILVKVAMTPPRRFPTLSDPLGSLANWPFYLGLAFYGAAFLLYAAALNVAQPVLTLGAIAAVTAISILVFREPFQWTTGAGILLMMTGVALITARVA